MARFPKLSERSNALQGRGLGDAFGKAKQFTFAAWGRTSRRMRLAGGIILFLVLSSYLSLTALQTAGVALPSVSLNYHYQQQATKFNESKVALLIENRAFPILAPLMLHFISVVPPDWRFRFMGSLESVEHINKSVAIREQVKAGKLDLTYIPANMTTGSQEEISRFLTNLWLYEVVLQPAEWLLIFQTDSILCANSKQNLNDYLDYDWIGAPWSPNARFGGNGGLSVRRVSAIIDVLRQQQREDGSEPEDVWLTDRLGHRPGAKLANGTVSLVFSGEMFTGEGVSIEHGDGKALRDPDGNGTATNTTSPLDAAKDGAYVEGIDDWREGFYEPMGYHTGGSGKWLHTQIWGTPKLRKHIWDYCPEVKMTLAMDAAKFVPGTCGAEWKKKRGLDDDTGFGFIGLEGEHSSLDLDGESDRLEARGYDTEIIDGVEYPVIPGLMPW
ncbi:hypothetical protein B0H67DRAFT_492142 [Lasiosphaeris hirsuta]|uniref:DUF5672 domain-containing protein n=1 Tax=Lasiosphaeris hirsuta TaxID=260670 RepID=A0AA40DTC6_9PEZI|nr:hypothetical protein B0H67DRAFT_492142 [Lasiosphaeris hirsuta]